MKRKIVGKVMLPVFALFVLSILVFRERAGIGYEQTDAQAREWNLSYSDEVEQDIKCLILTSDEDVSCEYGKMMEFVCDSMKLGCKVQDAGEGFDAEELERYDTVVVTFQDWSVLKEQLLDMYSWVKEGGRLLTALTPIPNSYFQAVSAKFGIDVIEEYYPPVYGVKFLKECVIGADEDDIFWYDAGKLEGIVSSLAVELKSECEVYMVSEDGNTPIIWTNDYGKGRIGIVNEVITQKYQRGFLALAYSLLEDVFVYPVINASAFYLDDFPSPIPAGNAEYIKRDYGVDVASFYANIWWPKMMEWEEKYGIVHTGMIIENYSDEVEAPFDGDKATARFLTFGNMLLNNGGELGFHGYNHMPLCLEGRDEDKKYGEYKLWKSESDMRLAVSELVSFSESLFPDNEFQVYVPPSNILSEAGRKNLLIADPGIKVIASTFLNDSEEHSYEQEFKIEDDGIISTPRITSGCIIDDYQKLVALSELNFQYVQSHFTHPDDTMDEDRGAGMGWDYMSRSFEQYLDWVYTSAPNIRNVTGSGMGKAVEKYDRLTMKRKYTDEGIRIKLGSFSGDASFILRVNEGSVEGTEGCSCENISGNIYLLTAYSDEIMIYLGGEK